MKMGDQTYFLIGTLSSKASRGASAWTPQPHSAPIWRARQRTNRPKQHWHPLVQGQALHLHRVPQDVQRNERHGMLSPADLCGDGQSGADADGPQVSTPSDRRGGWL